MNSLTAREFDASLKANTKRVSPFQSTAYPCSFKCLVCKHRWTTGRASLGKRGCPECKRVRNVKALTRTTEEYKELLQLRNPGITCLGEYKGSFVYITHRHELCGHVWDAIPVNLIRPNGEARGCPKCKLRLKETMLGNRTVKVRGYEDKALRYLSTIFTPKQINVQNEKTVPTIGYYFRGSQRRYFPDIYIPHKKTLVEVKSLSTVGLLGNMYSSKPSELFYITRAKALASMEAGFKFKLLIMPERGYTPYKIPSRWYELTFKEFKESVLHDRL